MKSALKHCIYFLLILFISSTSLSAKAIELQGAGATYPYPLYIKMFDEYRKKTGVRVNYQGIGSGGGIRQLKAKTVDFGATDAFLTDADLKKHFKQRVLHVPICSGAVALIHNIKGVKNLKLTPQTLSAIFQGKIRYWNDSRIAAINPNLKLPKLRITPVFRADSSGTTLIFSEYLSKVSAEWAKNYGTGKSIRSKVGLSGKGNAGVAGLVKQIKGSIGYVGSVYAIQNKMPMVALENQSKNFVEPTLKSITAAVSDNIPLDTRASITNTNNPDGYPISGLTWIIVYQDKVSEKQSIAQASELKRLLNWMIADGQTYTQELNYAPLSKGLSDKAQKIIAQLSY